MRILKLTAVLLVASVAAWGAADDKPASTPAEEPPKPTGLVESVENRLVQLDVGVEGDPAAIRAITAKDFVLRVGGHEIQGLIVDRMCGDEPAPVPPVPHEESQKAQPPVAAAAMARPRSTFIFFFDQPHLTMAGRAMSLETTRHLIDRLIVDGTSASIVSNGRRLETIVPLTSDRDRLLAGLEKLRKDPAHWDEYSETEKGRMSRVAGASNKSALAHLYATEEWEEVRRSTERIRIAMGVVAERPAPKGLVYFGDTLRQNAGLHYLHLAGVDDAVSAEMVPAAAAELDAVVNEALARGVHFFTIQAEGLTATRPGWDTERHRHAADTLVSLAAETGGEAFLGGASGEFIVRRIAARTSCAFLLSFPPADIPRDIPLFVSVELHVPKVKLRAQGRIVVPSEAAIEHAEILAAFADPAAADDGSLRILLVPRGGDGKTWHAEAQLRLRPGGYPDSDVELGASIVRGDEVGTHFASSIGTSSGTRPVVLEKDVDIPPGEFSVVAVSRDVKRGDLAARRLEANWPNPAKSKAAIAPIAVLQTGPAAISKDGDARSSGSLAMDVDEALDPDASVAFASVVCRGAKTKVPVVVERWIEGHARSEFAPMTIDPGADSCVETVDIVQAGRLAPGVTDYLVVARIGDEIAAQERRTLRMGTATAGK